MKSIAKSIKGLFYASIFSLFAAFFLMSFQTSEVDFAAESGPSASFSINNNGCTGPCGITFINESVDAISYQWNFGDGNFSYEANPTHVYQDAGTYQVTLRAIGTTCSHDFIGEVDVIDI